MRPRIVMHTPEPRSGAAQYVANLVKALLAAGEAVVLFSPSNFAYLRDLSNAGATIVCAGPRSTAPAGLAARVARNLRFFAGSCIRQIRLIRSGDIVHFQFPLYFPAGLVLFILAKIQARGIVFTAHDPVPHKWLLPEPLRFMERGCLHLAYDLSDRIIVHHEPARELIARTFSQEPSKIAVIPHGSSAMNPDNVVAHPSEILDLLMFGSIREDKGLELAIAAVQKINAKELKVRLVIAGAVANAREQSYWDACQHTIERAAAGITVLERFVPDGEVEALLSGCHAVLLPYKDFTAESGVASVALAHGRAILATNAGGFAALLGAGDLGIPVQSPSEDAVEEAIRVALAIGLPELSRKGLRGLEFLRSARSWESVGAQTANLYAEMSPAAITKQHKEGILHG
jgi:glycosyltransferase involved in cell wall biosynthesis